MSNENQVYTVTIPLSLYANLVKESEALSTLCIYIDKANRCDDGSVKKTGVGTIDLEVINAIEDSIYG